MNRTVIIPVLIILLFSSQHSEALTGFEEFLLENPKFFRLVAISVCVLMALIMIGYNYFLTRQQVEKIVQTMSHEKKIGQNLGKEAADRLREYRKIPTGEIGDLSLPRAALVALGSGEKQYGLTPNKEVTIGRSFTNAVVVDRTSTSRHHAMIRPQKEGYVLHDLLSRAGTFVNSKKITSQVLQDGDVVGIGKENFLFKY